MEWTVVIAVKALPSAKTRLLPATSDPASHRALVEAIRADTVAAALAATGVGRVLLVADRADAGLEQPGTSTVVQTSPGLNGALRDGAAIAVARWLAAGVAALVGDLPALRSDELAAALDAAGGYPHAFVADAAGTGTTLLTAVPGQALQPSFGVPSAPRHAAFAHPLPAGPGLRTDVDTAADLAAALALGVGPSTSALLRGSERAAEAVHLRRA